MPKDKDLNRSRDAPLADGYEKLTGMSDEKVRAATGKSWPEWVATLDAVDATRWEHGAIAEHLREAHGVGDWWCQMVTVGYERLRGLRDVGQRRGGGYETNKSKTVSVSLDRLWRAFDDDDERAAWLPDPEFEFHRRTKPKSMRGSHADGTKVDLYFTAKGDSKSSVSVQHRGLPDRQTAESMKALWTERLDALAARLALVLAFLAFLAGCGGGAGDATLVVLNGRVWTGLDEAPFDGGLAIVDHRIAAVGSDDEIGRWVGDATIVIDADGGLVTPGFIDSHVHFLTGGHRLSSVQLRDAPTPEEFTRRIGEFAASVAAGTWITGGDWDHENWGGELPHAEWIDGVTPDHPVMVHRLDGHMLLANTAAMRAAGVDASTGDVPGGEIVRDARGRPTGVFKDNAMDLVSVAMPGPTPELDDRALEAAMSYVAAQGVTGVHHMGTFEELEIYRRAHAAGRLETRITACTPLPQWRRLADLVQAEGRGDDWLAWGCLKGFVDGSLGSHTAAFFEDFTDAPGDSGFFVNSADDLHGWTAAADSAGLQVAIHAIGDRAISTLLDSYASVVDDAGARDRRFRIEHAQHIAPTDFRRFADLGVIASMQPYHAIDDGRWAERVIGPERIETTYAFRSFLDHGVTLAFGSDWFVAPPTPIEGLYAAVTRRTLDGANPDGWVPEQKITLTEALRAYTAGGAFAAFDEADLGTLEVGKLADVTVLDRNLFEVPPAAIREASVAATIVGGRVVFEAGRSSPLRH